MRESRVARRILVRKPEGRNHLEHRGISGRIILNRIVEKWDREAMDWVDLTQHRDRWRDLVKTEMNIWFP
jgi:hypothetical protein